MTAAAGHGFLKDEALLTVVISPRHLAHTMDKRTRANDNCEYVAGAAAARDVAVAAAARDVAGSPLLDRRLKCLC
jgi:hypothetical protein